MKKTAKKLLSIALVLVMVLSLLPTTVMAAEGSGTEGGSTTTPSTATLPPASPSRKLQTARTAAEGFATVSWLRDCVSFMSTSRRVSPTTAHTRATIPSTTIAP